MTNPKHRQRLLAAQQDFARRTRGLSEHTLRGRLLSIVNRPSGVGPGRENPLVQAYAQQALDVMKTKGTIASAERELAELRRQPADAHYPGQPDKKAQLALRKEELERTINVEQGRLLMLAQDPMRKAQELASAAFDEADAAQARRDAIMARVAAHRAAEAEAELDEAAKRVIAGQSVDRD